MGIQGEEGFPHEGTINFVNNQVNPTTGSILVRGDFNPLPKGAAKMLSPGMFVGSGCQSANPIGPACHRSRFIRSDAQGLGHLRARQGQQRPSLAM